MDDPTLQAQLASTLVVTKCMVEMQFKDWNSATAQCNAAIRPRLAVHRITQVDAALLAITKGVSTATLHS